MDGWETCRRGVCKCQFDCRNRRDEIFSLASGVDEDLDKKITWYEFLRAVEAKRLTEKSVVMAQVRYVFPLFLFMQFYYSPGKQANISFHETWCNLAHTQNISGKRQTNLEKPLCLEMIGGLLQDTKTYPYQCHLCFILRIVPCVKICQLPF